MKAVFGIKWLVILVLAALRTQHIAATETTLDVISDEVTKNDDVLTEFLPAISTIHLEFIQMIYLIQNPMFPEEFTSNPFKPVKVCIVSEEELKEISTILENAGKGIDYPQIEIVRSSNCSETERIKLGILKLQNAFNELRKNKISSAKYEEIKSIYEEKLRQLQKKMDDAVENATSAERATIEKLRAQLQAQEIRIKSILQQLEEKQRKLDEVSSRLCISELKQNQIDAAVNAYRDMGDKSKMKEIISSAYEDINSFNKLFDFLHRVEAYKILGCFTLFDKMKSSNDLKALNIVKLVNFVIKNKGDANYQTMMEDALKLMYRNNGVDDFLNYDGSIDQDIMLTFVRIIYANDESNMAKLVETKFHSITNYYYLLNSLIITTKNCGHTNKTEFLFVVSTIKQYVNNVTDVFPPVFPPAKAEMVKNVPESLQPLLTWSICIQNVANNEFMHAAPLPLDNSRRSIYTTKSYFDGRFTFGVEFLDQGRKMLIKNLNYNDCLFAGDGYAPRAIFTGMKIDQARDDPRAHFTIEYVDDRNVRIKMLRFNEYVASDSWNSEGNDKRSVFAQKEVTSDTLWRLSNCKP